MRKETMRTNLFRQIGLSTLQVLVTESSSLSAPVPRGPIGLRVSVVAIDQLHLCFYLFSGCLIRLSTELCPHLDVLGTRLEPVWTPPMEEA